MAKPNLDDFITDPNRPLRRYDAIALLKSCGFKENKGSAVHKSAKNNGQTHLEIKTPEGVIIPITIPNHATIHHELRAKILQCCEEGFQILAQRHAAQNALEGPEALIAHKSQGLTF